MAKIKTALVYARQSSGDEEESQSIEAQIEACKQYALSKGYEIKGTFFDANISGKTYPDTVEAKTLSKADITYQTWLASTSATKRKNYRKGLAEALSMINEIDVFIVYDFTRLMRPLTDSFLESYIKQIIIKSNTMIETVREGEIDLTTFSAGLITSLESRINDNQIAIAKAKSMMQLKRLKDEGYRYTGANFLGFINAGKQKVMVNDDEMLIVKAMFEGVISGASYMQVLQKINAMPQAKRVYKYGDLQKVINRWEYCGKCLNSKGEVIESKVFPCVIPFATVVQAQQRFNNKKAPKNKDKKFVHPLSGLIYCGSCGGRLTINKSSTSGLMRNIETEPTFQYLCKNDYYTEETRKDCRLSGIREDYQNTDKNGIVSGLLPFVLVHLLNEKQKNQVNSDSLAEATLEIEKIEKLEKMLDKKLMNGDMDEAEYEARFSQYREMKKELQEKQRLLIGGQSNSIAEMIAEILDGIENHTPTSLNLYKKIAPEVFKKILVFPDYVEVYLTGKKEPVKIERIRMASARVMPTWIIYKSLNGKWQFIYKYKSYKQGEKNQPESIIFEDENTIVKTIGINPKPYEYLKKRKQLKRLERAERNLENYA